MIASAISRRELFGCPKSEAAALGGGHFKMMMGDDYEELPVVANDDDEGVVAFVNTGAN